MRDATEGVLEQEQKAWRDPIEGEAEWLPAGTRVRSIQKIGNRYGGFTFEALLEDEWVWFMSLWHPLTYPYCRIMLVE